MKILFFGDIVGKTGRIAIKKSIQDLVDKYQPDFVIANAENIAHGTGLTPKTIAEMQEVGIDFFTGGNHTWDKPLGETVLQDPNPIAIRPANYESSKSGKGYGIVSKNGKKILVINVEGTVFMSHEKPLTPFESVDQILDEFKDEKFDAIVVDHHAEATSEKRALGFYLDGKTSLVVGTHTHVPTADAQVLPKGTAYITDIGMNGSLNSVLGFTTDSSIAVCKGRGEKVRLVLEESSPAELNAVIAEINDDGKAKNIEHIRQVIKFG